MMYIKSKRKTKLLLATVVAIALTTIGTASATLITGPTVITKPGIYVINQDFINSTVSTFIRVESSNVVIDGNGHLIEGNLVNGVGNYPSYGIYVYNSTKTLTNITIKDLKLLDWERGIYLSNSSYNTLTNIIANNNSWAGIWIYGSSYNTLTNIIANNNSWAGIWIGKNSSYNTLTNITANNNLAGIWIGENSSYNTLNHIVTSSNLAGIWICKNSSYNTLTNTIASNNLGAGVCFNGSSYNTLTNITANNNDLAGIWVYYGLSYNNTLTNITANNNKEIGIHLNGSYNTLNNIIANNNNLAGVWIGKNSSYNILNNSIIKYNTNYGLYIKSSSNNLIYNNYFNNSKNVLIEGACTNKWNITPTSGKNIVGGPYIAGNYWATPSNTGFSQTHADKNGDGICDTPYKITTNNIDYYPLAKLKNAFNPMKYDTNHNGRIDFNELLKAIGDWMKNKISFKELEEVIAIWMS